MAEPLDRARDDEPDGDFDALECPDCGAPLLWFKRPEWGWWECSNKCGWKTPPSVHMRDREAKDAD